MIAKPKEYTQAEFQKHKARAAERAALEEEERQRKLAERERIKQERMKAEKMAFYSKLETLDYDLLTLQGYPSDYEIESAKRQRKVWFIALGVVVFLFLASLFSLVSKWVGGIAGGAAFFLWLTYGNGLLEKFPSLNTYTDLINERRKIKRQLLEYIKKLEGSTGYLHKLYSLSTYNPALEDRKYKQLALMSKEGTLLANFKILRDTDNYKNFLKEALKGYHEMKIAEEEDKLTEDIKAAAAEAEGLEQEKTFDIDLLDDEEKAELAKQQEAELIEGDPQTLSQTQEESPRPANLLK